jgi:hypothetical protein
MFNLIKFIYDKINLKMSGSHGPLSWFDARGCAPEIRFTDKINLVSFMFTVFIVFIIHTHIRDMDNYRK